MSFQSAEYQAGTIKIVKLTFANWKEIVERSPRKVLENPLIHPCEYFQSRTKKKKSTATSTAVKSEKLQSVMIQTTTA